MYDTTIKIYADGTKLWTRQNPKEWYKAPVPHRIDGPAFSHPTGLKEYWINGKIIGNEQQITREEFLARGDTRKFTLKEVEDFLGYKLDIGTPYKIITDDSI